MAEVRGKKPESIWDRLRSKAANVVARPSAALVRGMTAARDVFDDEGNLLVSAGREIDDEVIEKATAAGKMPAVVAAAVSAQQQDLQEKLKGKYERTPEGRERRNLDNSDAYIEARGYIKWVAAVEVTDIRGSVLIPAGKTIEDEDVRKVREANQLAALIYSAQQSGPPPTRGKVESALQSSPTAASAAPEVKPEQGYLPPKRRTAVPLGETFEE